MELILLQENSYFTKESWIQIFKNEIPNYDQRYKLNFVKNTREIAEQIHNIDHCFCLKLADDTILSEINIKTLYHAISDIDYIDINQKPTDLNLFTSKGLASQIIAEYCLTAAFNLTRRYEKAIINKTKKRWDQSAFLSEPTKSISEYKIGILGLGNNGGEIVKKFKTLGCNVAGYSNNPKEGYNLDMWCSETELSKILQFSDILILALPLRNETSHLIGMNELKLLGENSFLINVGRGKLVNEKELIQALNNNTIRGAALDVTEKEPLPKNSKLWKTKNLIITPHIAGNINAIVSKIQLDFIQKLTKELEYDRK